MPANVIITKATLRLTGQNSFSTHGACTVDLMSSSGFDGALALVNGDFEWCSGVVAGVATLSDPAGESGWSSGALNAASLSAITNVRYTLFRAGFIR